MDICAPYTRESRLLKKVLSKEKKKKKNLIYISGVVRVSR